MVNKPRSVSMNRPLGDNPPHSIAVHFPNPTLSLPFDERAVCSIISRIHYLFKYENSNNNRRHKQAILAKKVGMTESNFSKWINGAYKWDHITEPKFAVIIDYLINEQVINSRDYVDAIEAFFPAATYHAITAFWDIQRVDIDHTLNMITGRYKLYRPSMFYPGYTFIAEMKIYYDSCTNSIRTYEFYRCSGKDSLVAAYWHIHGFLISKSGYKVIISKPISGDIQTKYISSWNQYSNPINPPDSNTIITMEGTVSDMQSGRAYTAPMFYVRLNDNEEMDWDVTRNEDVPIFIKERFNKFPSADFINTHISVF